MTPRARILWGVGIAAVLLWALNSLDPETSGSA